ncbi:helix-turn-helix domain-containing protein [Streptomyces mirabilis]|uniref:helix-turn-helix domain-containing protein n=1 Tax=Streptomyces mirabilis TaxID=68239 RepID=UPI003676F72D
MARPEAPVDFTVQELGELAEFLRSLRRTAGLTYAELAERSTYSAATLKRAATGKALPDVKVAFEYALGCQPHGQPISFTGRDFISRWEAAERAVAKAKKTARRSTVLPKPQLARDQADLSGALRDAWARAGRPSTRLVEKASHGQVPRSTANVIATAHTFPRDIRQYIAFLRACEIEGKALAPWFQAWFKVVGAPSAVQPALKAMGADTEAMATYVALYAQVTGEAVSVVEELARFAIENPERRAAQTRRVVRQNARGRQFHYSRTGRSERFTHSRPGPYEHLVALPGSPPVNDCSLDQAAAPSVWAARRWSN